MGNFRSMKTENLVCIIVIIGVIISSVSVLYENQSQTNQLKVNPLLPMNEQMKVISKIVNNSKHINHWNGFNVIAWMQCNPTCHLGNNIDVLSRPQTKSSWHSYPLGDNQTIDFIHKQCFNTYNNVLEQTCEITFTDDNKIILTNSKFSFVVDPTSKLTLTDFHRCPPEPDTNCKFP